MCLSTLCSIHVQSVLYRHMNVTFGFLLLLTLSFPSFFAFVYAFLCPAFLSSFFPFLSPFYLKCLTFPIFLVISLYFLSYIPPFFSSLLSSVLIPPLCPSSLPFMFHFLALLPFFLSVLHFFPLCFLVSLLLYLVFFYSFPYVLPLFPFLYVSCLSYLLVIHPPFCPSSSPPSQSLFSLQVPYLKPAHSRNIPFLFYI